MAETLKPEICVIGAGSGGLTVAAVCAAFGVSCVLIEKGKMGGDCLNYGCVPSKALLAAAHHAQSARQAGLFGIKLGSPAVEFEKVHKHVHEVIAAIAPNDSEERFTGMGVTVIRKEAAFVDKKTLKAGVALIKARHFVIATGSSPRIPDLEGLDEIGYLTNETIFDLKVRPRHLVILGGGPVGIEMAQAFTRLGARVTVVEGSKAMSKDDPEAASIVLDRLRAEGVKIIEGAQAIRAERQGEDGVRLVIRQGERETKVDGSHLLVAVGRAANVKGLNLEAAEIAYDSHGIKVSSSLKTTNRHVYAIGDVAGGLQFTHVANYHAGLVVQNALFGVPVREKRDHVPWVTYTDPELAQVGLSEAEAMARHGRDIRIIRWPYAENDRAQAERQTSGFIKVVTDKKGRILGATIVGAMAGEMINMWSLAISQKLKISAMRGFVAPYPTRSEISKRAAVAFYADLPRSALAQRMLKAGRLLSRFQ